MSVRHQTSRRNFHAHLYFRLTAPDAHWLRRQSEGSIRYRAARREAVQQAARYETLPADRRRISRLALRQSGKDSFSRVGKSALVAEAAHYLIFFDRV